MYIQNDDYNASPVETRKPRSFLSKLCCGAVEDDLSDEPFSRTEYNMEEPCDLIVDKFHLRYVPLKLIAPKEVENLEKQNVQCFVSRQEVAVNVSHSNLKDVATKTSSSTIISLDTDQAAEKSEAVSTEDESERYETEDEDEQIQKVTDLMEKISSSWMRNDSKLADLLQPYDETIVATTKEDMAKRHSLQTVSSKEKLDLSSRRVSRKKSRSKTDLNKESQSSLKATCLSGITGYNMSKKNLVANEPESPRNEPAPDVPDKLRHLKKCACSDKTKSSNRQTKKCLDEDNDGVLCLCDDNNEEPVKLCDAKEKPKDDEEQPKDDKQPKNDEEQPKDDKQPKDDEEQPKDDKQPKDDEEPVKLGETNDDPKHDEEPVKPHETKDDPKRDEEPVKLHETEDDRKEIVVCSNQPEIKIRLEGANTTVIHYPLGNERPSDENNPNCVCIHKIYAGQTKNKLVNAGQGSSVIAKDEDKSVQNVPSVRSAGTLADSEKKSTPTDDPKRTSVLEETLSDNKRVKICFNGPGKQLIPCPAKSPPPQTTKTTSEKESETPDIPVKSKYTQNNTSPESTKPTKHSTKENPAEQPKPYNWKIVISPAEYNNYCVSNVQAPIMEGKLQQRKYV